MRPGGQPSGLFLFLVRGSGGTRPEPGRKETPCRGRKSGPVFQKVRTECGQSDGGLPKTEKGPKAIQSLKSLIFLFKIWCRRSELNRHDRGGRGILSPLRLPVSPLRQLDGLFEKIIHKRELILMKRSQYCQEKIVKKILTRVSNKNIIIFLLKRGL